MTTCWRNRLIAASLAGQGLAYKKGFVVLCLISFGAATFSLPASCASSQMQPVLKAIDPSQAKYDTLKPEPKETSEDNAGKDAQTTGPHYKYQPYDDTATGGPVPQTYAPSSVYGSDNPAAPTSAPNPQDSQFPSPAMLPSFDQNFKPPAQEGPTQAGQDNAAQMWMTTSEVPVAPSPAESRGLARLEQAIFGATYPDHDFASRLNHLEKESLGSTSQGSYGERIRTLNAKIGMPTAFGTPASAAPSAPGGNNMPAASFSGNDATRIIQGMPSHPKAGDYLALIKPLGAGIYPHWSAFPVRIHLPQDCPETWKKELVSGVESWNKSVPINIVGTADSPDIEVIWVNHLVPRLLGIARIIVNDGKMRGQIFLLRPTFYLREVPERALEQVFLHELGHALGITGHSDTKSDIMYAIEITSDNKTTFTPAHNPAISPRDVNTLKRIYSSPAQPPNFTLATPVEWGSYADAEQLSKRQYQFAASEGR